MGITSLGLHSTFLNSQQHTIKHEYSAFKKKQKKLHVVLKINTWAEEKITMQDITGKK